jgi:hypothetical protein
MRPQANTLSKLRGFKALADIKHGWLAVMRETRHKLDVRSLHPLPCKPAGQLNLWRDGIEGPNKRWHRPEFLKGWPQISKHLHQSHTARVGCRCRSFSRTEIQANIQASRNSVDVIAEGERKTCSHDSLIVWMLTFVETCPLFSREKTGTSFDPCWTKAAGGIDRTVALR